jgi:hypothetical protein
MAHVQIVPVDEIGIFIGYVAADDSTDGVDKNDQTDLTEQVRENIDEPEDENFSIQYNSVDYGGSIDEDAYYGSDIEPTPMESDPEPLSSGFTDPMGVYVVDGNTNSTPNVLSTPISAENAAAA